MKGNLESKVKRSVWDSGVRIKLRSENQEEKELLKELHLRHPLGFSVESDMGWIQFKFEDVDG